MRRFCVARRFFSANPSHSGRHDSDPMLLLSKDKLMVQVEVIGARELFKKGKAVDAYCTLRLGTTVYRTQAARRTSDPVFGETFVLDFGDDADQLVFEVWDQETFGKDDLMGVAVTTVEQIKKGQAAQEPSSSKRGLETFFHLIPPAPPASEATRADRWQKVLSSGVQAVIERSRKAGAEAAAAGGGGWLSFLSKELQQKIQTDAVVPQGRLYVKFRVAAASELGTVLPSVVPPAVLDPAKVRLRPRKDNREWDQGLSPPPRNFRVLALDGGGVRGVLTAGILRRLTKEGRFPSLLDDVDLIAGTSTGGILALLFAAGYTPAEAQRLYMFHCPKIFTTSPARRYSPFSAKYENTYLLRMMQAHFQDLRIDELPRQVLVTAFKIRSDPGDTKATFFQKSGKGWRPALFSNMPVFSGRVEPDAALCSDVAIRTSAAPTYFPTYQHYVDGAIFANNPSLSAIAKSTSHLKHLKAARHRIAVLSVGAGDFSYFIPESEADASMDWGLRQWAPYLRSILLDSSAISLETNMSLLMGDMYHRVNPRLPSDMDLDDCGTIPELHAISRKYDLTQTEDWIRSVFYQSHNPLDDV